MADFSFKAMRRQAKHVNKLAFMEQPEDLGKTTRPRIPGHQPASMWQFPQFQLALQEGLRTAFSQLDFGSESKAHSFLAALRWEATRAMVEGPPQLDEDGVYLEPLPPRKGVPLIHLSRC